MNGAPRTVSESQVLIVFMVCRHQECDESWCLCVSAGGGAFRRSPQEGMD